MAGLNLFTNNAASTLASSINSSVTSLTVASGQGTLFPNPTAGQYFYCTLSNTAGTIIEIVKVTARSTDTFTIVRGQDNTTASAFSAGDKVELRLTAADLNNFGQLDSTNTWASGQVFVAPVLGTPASGNLANCTFPTLNQNTTGTAAGLSSTLAVSSGGTGQSTYTTGDIIYASATNTLAKQAIGTTGQILTVSGGLPVWATPASGASNQLVSSIPLKSGTSVVAGNIVGINLAGETGEVPTLNTYGTKITAANVGTGTLSTDGSRMLQWTGVLSGNNYTATFRGSAVNQTTGVQTVGATTVTGTTTNSYQPAQFGTAYIYAISPTTFLCAMYSYNSYECCGTFYYSIPYKYFVVTVDGSGNCTKGTEYYSTNAAGFSGTPVTFGFQIAQLTTDIYVVKYYYGTSSSPTTNYYTVTVSGTTVTQTTDTEAQYFLNSTIYNTLLTSNNIIVAAYGTYVRTASYSAGNIGTYTDTTYITDNSNTPSWSPVTTTGFLCAYNTLTDSRLKSFTVNQTTGALTLADTLINPAFTLQKSAWKTGATYSGAFFFQSTGNRANSISLNSNGTFPNPRFNTGGVGTLEYGNGDTPVYTTGNSFLFFYPGNSSNAPTITPYTVNAYATSSFNYLGVCKTSTSTSPASVVTSGVANGFTGLTSGSIYYVTAPFDGTVTLTTTSGVIVGKAISTTEILLGRTQ